MKNLCNVALLAAAGLIVTHAASAQAKSAAAPAASAAAPAKSAKATKAPAVKKSPAGAMSMDARKAQIMENLKLRFPQLGTMNATMGEIKPSPWPGIDEGSFSMSGQQGQQQMQKFLVSSDNTALFLLMMPEPINVSLDEAGRAAEKVKMDAERAKADADAKRAAEEKMKGDAVKAKETAPEMAKSIEGLPFRGKANAPVTIVEFSDFQCPYCSRGFKTMEEVMKKYPNDVKFAFKHYPLPMHPWAKPAAIAAYCASQQNGDAFWMLHDGYFNHQGEVNAENLMAKSKEFLAGSKLDMKKWSACAETKESPEYKAAEKAVDDSVAFGTKHGVSGTPGFFVNGMFINGAQPVETFDAAIAAVKNAAGAPAPAPASAPMDKKN
jgi:protein-disulfide isomerase